MNDIFLSVPWQDHDKGQVWWSMANYWTTDDGGYTVDYCADGDHEPIEPDDIPGADEIARAWSAYHSYCAMTGTDPLGEYFIRTTCRTVERWQVYFVRSIAGLCIQKVRRAGRDYLVSELPKSIKDYLLIRNNGTSNNTEADYDDIAREGFKLNRWETIRLEHCTPRKPSAIKRDIKRVAHRRLKEI